MLTLSASPASTRRLFYLDGIRLTTSPLDLYAAARSWRRTVFTTTVATGGPHTLRIHAAGSKSASSSDTKVPVDAFAFVG